MAPARRSARGSRNSRRSAPASRSGRASARSGAQPGSSRRASRDDDDPRSSSRRSARGSARGGSSNDNTLIIAGVVGAVVVLGGGIFLLSGSKKKPPPRREEERAPPPKAASVRNWYTVGRNDGASWARQMKRRGSMAGGNGDIFAKDEVLDIADRKTSDHWNEGLKGDAAGEKKYIEGFCAGVKAVVGR